MEVVRRAASVAVGLPRRRACLTRGVRRYSQQAERPHPLSQTPTPAGVRPTAAPGGGSAPRQGARLSALSAVLLATLTGTTTYVIGLRNGPAARGSEKAVDPTYAGFEKALKELRAVLPDDCISTDREDLASYSQTDWTYHDARALPGAVLFPRSTEDVVHIVKLASAHNIPLVPSSGRTSLEGHFHAPNFASNPREKLVTDKLAKGEKVDPEELVSGLAWHISFAENMNEILKVNEKDLDVVVQPGVPYEILNAELKDRGVPLFFPVDPGPGAMIGGMVGTGCSGTNAVRYGTMRENVLNLTVVLPSGEVIKTRQRAKKSSVGPDLARLFIGSEGILGIVVEATLKLQPVLPYSVAVSSFPTIEAAAATARDLIQHGVGLACVELLDGLMMTAVNQKNTGMFGKGARKWQETPTLFLKFSGTEGQIKSDIEHTKEISKGNGGSKLVFAKDRKEADDIWYSRKIALWSALEYLPGSRCWTTDVCVPLSGFPTLLKETAAEIASHGIIAPVVSHAGDGNAHFLLLFRDDKELAVVKDLVHRMVERAQALDGTATGEHGVGEGKREYLLAELGPGTVDLLRDIKKLVDPKNIMNPGKLLLPEGHKGGH